MVDLLFSWRFIEILRYKQTARSKPLTENCVCTFDTAHHGSDQRIPHSISFLKEITLVRLQWKFVVCLLLL